MDKFTYNMFYEIEKPTVILSTVAHKHYGVLENIDFDSFQCNFNMNSAQEISFDVYKFMDEHECSLWSKLISFKYIYIPQHHEYYKIDVTLDQDDKTVKHITGTSAGEWELSNRKIQSMDINTAGDTTYDETYNPQNHTYEEVTKRDSKDKNDEVTILYNPNNTHKSVLHRALADRAPDWSIDSNIVNTLPTKVLNAVRVFSVSNQTVYDFLTNTVAQELDLLFKFDSVNRIISVYDLLNQCGNCGERGNFTNTCPKCGSTNILHGYGEDTHIFISANNYANRISVDGDEGSVKNCFKVSGGDDVMTATVKNCNASGSEYIYRFSEADYDDMPTELVTKLRQYNTTYDYYMNGDNTADPPVRPYPEITKDLYNTWAEYYYYKTSMMPRTANNGHDIGHWQPTTNDHIQSYDVGDTCYVYTLPSYCYLVCTHAGRAGRKEFDCTNVINIDDPNNPVVIKEHDYDEDATVEWTVVRHIVSIPTSVQALRDIENFCNSQDNYIYFEDPIFTGVTANPPVFSRLDLFIKDYLATFINPLFRIEIIKDTQSWVTNSYVPGVTPAKIKQGTYTFQLKVTNTTDSSDVAQTTGSGLQVRCVWSETTKELQNYMNQLVAKKLVDQKDETYDTIWKTSKTKIDSFDLTSSTRQRTIACDFKPEYICLQYLYGEDEYKVVYYESYGDDGTTTYHTDYYKNKEINSTDTAGTLTVSQTGFTFRTYHYPVTCFYTAINDEKFRGMLKQYSLDMLTIFLKSYDACRQQILGPNGINAPENSDFHGVDLYHNIYEPYNRRVDFIGREVDIREAKIKELYNDPKQVDESTDIPIDKYLPYDKDLSPGRIQQIQVEMYAVQDALDIQEFLKDPSHTADPDWLWHALFNYLRDGEYQNSNYISDGLSENQQVEYAQELLEKAKEELVKASELQYTLSDDLINLLNTEDFAPFKDKFNLGDFIVCGVGDNKDNLDIDNHNYRLRLISLSYSYGSPESVSVTFSNATKIKNYFSDTQDILAQAKSMGSSYNAVTHQVDKNKTTTETVVSWNENGLQSGLTRILNNNREEVTYDNNGIIVKSFDFNYNENKDNDEYSDEQLRITHNVIMFTNDNWKTARLGLGKQNYQYYDDNDVVQTGDDYGLIAKFVDAGYIHGTQIIGGEIYSQNYTVSDGVPTEGTHLKLDDGTFTMCGNLFKGYYDSANSRYRVDITGDIHATSLTLEPGADIPDLGYVKYDHPYGTVQEGSVGYQLSSAGLLTATNAVIYGTIYAGAGYIGSSTTVADRWAIGDKGIYKGINSTSASGNGSYIGTDGIKTVQGNNSVLIQNGSITANSCNFTGGTIGGWTINQHSISVENTTNHNYVYLNDGSDAHEDILVVRQGTVGNYTYPFHLHADGSVTMAKATVTGAINATSGTFSGNITSTATISGGTLSGSTITGANIKANTFTAYTEIKMAPNSSSTEVSAIKMQTTGGIQDALIIPRYVFFNEQASFAKDVLFSKHIQVDEAADFISRVNAAKLCTTSAPTTTSSANARLSTQDDPGLLMLVSGSSIRYKHDFSTKFDEILDPYNLYDVKVYQYKYQTNYLDNKNDIRYDTNLVGFIAEELYKHYPIAVDWHYDGDKKVVDDWSDRYIIPPMLYLIQDQKKEIDALKQEIEDLKSRIQ